MMCWSPTWPCLLSPRVSCWWAPCARLLEAVLRGQPPAPQFFLGEGSEENCWGPRPCSACSSSVSLALPGTYRWLCADHVLRLQAAQQPQLLSPPGDQHSLFPHQRASARPQESSYCSGLEGCLYLRILGRPFISKKCLLILGLAQLPEIMSRVTKMDAGSQGSRIRLRAL